MTFTARPHRTWGRPTARLLVMTCLILPAIGATAEAAPTRHVRATAHGRSVHGHSNRTLAIAARTFPPALNAAARHARRADRALVSNARGLKRCLRNNHQHPRRCTAARRAVQRAGTRLARAERRLARIARRTGTSGIRVSGSVWPNLRQAPQLTVSGLTLSWTRVANINTYVLLSKVPGQTAKYSVVSGTSVTPPPVPGLTVRYSVRTTTNRSAWSTEQAITYPSTPPTNTQAAPTLAVSGQTLTWSAVANVNTYVLRRSISGQADRFSVVSGNSVTPAALSGVTVFYSVRTAVDGSAWSPQVSIVYPAAAPPPSRTVPEGTSAGFQPGLTSGSDALYDPPGAAKLGARVVRIGFAITASVKSIEPVIAMYAAKGIRVVLLADFDSSMPNPAEATSLATWAGAFGPGGTFWAGHSNGGLAVTSIEFGNETSYSYQYPDDTPSGYASRAQAYAVSFAVAATAIRASNPGVGLLAQGDSGNAGPAWVQNMFKAVPDLGQLVVGWTIHPYGPGWHERLVNLVNQTAAQGAPSTIPIDMTEWGLSTDNGRCLTANFGWNKCMTYQEAGDVLTRTVSEMRQLLGSRMGLFMLYQVRDQRLTGASTDIEGYFGALQHELQPKGAFTQAVEALMAS